VNTRDLHVVSVSLGSARRDVQRTMTLLGRTVHIERVGVDGDLRKAERLLKARRDEVDAFGLGGTDLLLHAAGRTYLFRESARLARAAGGTPVVCGAGLKRTLEGRAVDTLDARLHWRGKRVLIPSAVDRWGMAEALDRRGAQLRIGDLAFLLGVPLTFRRLSRFEPWVRAVAPLATRLPVRLLYPTGAQQHADRGGWRSRLWDGVDAVAGDFHLIRRDMPARMDGTGVLTNTTTREDLEGLWSRGAAWVATTTPRLEGRSLPTNLLEAAFVAVSGRSLLTEGELRRLVGEADLAPTLVFNPQAA
jgi:hypothetical protein